MSEARIERLVAAAIHQAIGDIVPSRLEFYESYLRPRGWREDAVNLAPVAAVLSFLRHEPEGTYNQVMTRAADYAAGWVHDAMPWRTRALLRVGPAWVRLRRLASIVRQHLDRSYRGTSVAITVRRGELRLTVAGSIFCSTRDPDSAPHCLYYAAFVEHLLTRAGVDVAHATIDDCRARGGDVCRLHVVVGTAPAPAVDPASVPAPDSPSS